VVGTEEEIEAAFEHAYRIIRARIEAFLALPPGLDKHQLKLDLDRIGGLSVS